MAWLTGWGKRYPITLSDTSVTSRLVKITITDTAILANAKRNGEDVRVYDDTTGLECKHVVFRWDRRNSYAQIMCLVATGTNTHYLYVGNAAAATSADRTILLGGTDFSNGTAVGVGENINGTGVSTVLAAAESVDDPRLFQTYRTKQTPSLVAPSPYEYVRELSILRDTSNNAVVENGKIFAYVMLRNSGADTTGDVGYTESADNGATWSIPTVVLSHGIAGEDDATIAVQASVLKVADNDYRMVYVGRNGDDPANSNIMFATSTDRITWTKQGKCFDRSLLTDVLQNLSVPYLVRFSDGNYYMALEAIKLDGHFNIFLVSNTDLTRTGWTAFNGGNPILSPTGTGWEAWHVANPKITETTPGNYILEYNGMGPDGTKEFCLGSATSTNLTTWTRSTNNPVIAGRLTTYGAETSSLARLGENWVHLHQYFTGASDTASIYYSEALPQKGALLRASAAGDAAFISKSLAGITTFTAETSCFIASTYNDTGSRQRVLALLDVVTINATTYYTTEYRLAVVRTGFEHTTPGDFYVTYNNTSGVAQYWNGTAWGATVHWFAADTFTGLKARLSDDGTNYIITVFDDKDSLVTTATIAKASVQAITNTRVLVSGTPYHATTARMGTFSEYLAVTPYNATEPATTLGAEESEPAPASSGYKGLDLSLQLTI